MTNLFQFDETDCKMQFKWVRINSPSNFCKETDMTTNET